MPKTEIVPQFSLSSYSIPPAWKATNYLQAYQGWVYTAINALAQEFANAKIRLYKKKYIRNEVDYIEVEEHEALSLLDEVNPYSNGYTLRYETALNLQLMGEAYWAIMRQGGDLSSSENSKPVSIWTLRPDYVTLYPSETKLIDHYGYSVSGQEVKIASENIVPFKLPNPQTPYRGKSPVAAASMAIDTDDFTASWQRNFFYNSALPNLILTTDQQLKEDQIRKLTASWQQSFGSKENAHKVAFLSGGFKTTEIGQKMTDMNIIELKNHLRDQILGAFKVPKTIIGLSDDVNRANAEATTASFISRTVVPMLRMFVSYLNEFYLPLFSDDSLFFDFDDPTPEDVQTKLQIYDNGLKNGWLTINEVRREENRPPVEGGDVIYLNMQMQPIGSQPSEPTNLSTPTRSFLNIFRKQPEEKIVKLKATSNKKPHKFNISIPHKRLKELRTEAINKEIQLNLIKILQLAMKLDTKKKNTQQKEALKEGFWKSMIGKTDVLEQEMVNTLNGLFQQQRNEVYNRLDQVKGKSIKTPASDYIFDLKLADDMFRNAFKDFIKRIVEERGLEMLSMVGSAKPLDLHTIAMVDFLNSKGLEFIKSVNETTKDNLLMELMDGVELGESISQLKDRVRKVYDIATQSRAEMIARTEVLRSTNFATHEAYVQSGVVKGQEWLTSLDADTCDECHSLDGKVVPLDEEFKINGKTVDDPPVHPNCRCTILPVLTTRSANAHKKATK